jgi:hypothetical protein
MASNSHDAGAQVNALAHAQAAAVKRVRVPVWYWAAAGVGIGYAVFALGTFLPVQLAAAVLLVTAGSRLLAIVLLRATGIRFRGIIGEAASWLKIAYVVAIAIAFALAISLDRATASSWPGVILGGLTFVATLAFGQGYNWLLRHRAP